LPGYDGTARERATVAGVGGESRLLQRIARYFRIAARDLGLDRAQQAGWVPRLPLIGHVLSLVIASSLSAHVPATVPATNALQREDRGGNHARDEHERRDLG
jgi:hypothetical protein